MKNKPISYIKMLPVIVYPYLYMIGIVILLLISVISNNENAVLFSLVGTIILGLLVTIIDLIIVIKNSISSSLNTYGDYYPTFMNLLVKGIQIPAYVINFIIGLIGCLMSIWGIGIVFFVIVVDFLTIMLSGINAMGMNFNLANQGLMTKKRAFWFSVLSFLYCVDVALAIYLYIWRRKDYIKKAVDKVTKKDEVVEEITQEETK